MNFVVARAFITNAASAMKVPDHPGHFFLFNKSSIAEWEALPPSAFASGGSDEPPPHWFSAGIAPWQTGPGQDDTAILMAFEF